MGRDKKAVQTEAVSVANSDASCMQDSLIILDNGAGMLGIPQAEWMAAEQCLTNIEQKEATTYMEQCFLKNPQTMMVDLCCKSFSSG